LLIGAAFWPVLAERMDSPEYASLDYGMRIDHAVDSVTRNLRLPKRENALLKQVLIARRRLRPEGGQRRRRGSLFRMAGKSYFTAAITFVEIEMRAEGTPEEEIQAWEKGLGVDSHPQERQPHAEDGEPRKRRRRRRRRPDGPPKVQSDS
jgi:hypothetical protein